MTTSLKHNRREQPSFWLNEDVSSPKMKILVAPLLCYIRYPQVMPNLLEKDIGLFHLVFTKR